MDRPVDQRGKLDAQVFTYLIAKGPKVFIAWHGKEVTTLSGDKAERFIADVEGLEDKDAQLLMARATGHFKHGNERPRSAR